MNGINIQNRQNYTPSFQANLINNYPLKGLLVSAIENAKYKEPLKEEIIKLKDIYINTNIELSKRKTKSGVYIPVIKNLTNGNMTYGLDIIKKGYTDFLDISYKLLKRLNDSASEERFQLFEQKGIRSRNNTRAVLAKLAEPSEVIKIVDGALDKESASLMDEFSKTASFKFKNKITYGNRNYGGNIQIKCQNKQQKVYLFNFFDDNSEQLSKAFKIIEDKNGYHIKRNDYTSREEVLDLIKDYIPKYLKLNKHSKEKFGQI